LSINLVRWHCLWLENLFGPASIDDFWLKRGINKKTKGKKGLWIIREKKKEWMRLKKY
jgi:hypothetical protein